jgi:hypothetical protein
MSLTHTALQQYYDLLGDSVVRLVREAGGRIRAVELQRLLMQSNEVPFVLGMLWMAERVALRPRLGGAGESWEELEVTIGHAEALRIAHGETEWATGGRRDCPRAGQVGHYGCGVCEHDRVYAACMPCFVKRCRGES